MLRELAPDWALPTLRGVKRAIREAALAAAFANAQGCVASYPKSGRTWFRFMVASYLNDRFDLGLKMDLHTVLAIVPQYLADRSQGRGRYRFGDRPEVPFLVVSHLPYRRLLFARKDVVFLVRDPRDVMVSAYFHWTRHSREFAGWIADLLRDPQYGMPSLVSYLNGWADGLSRHRHIVVAYEQLSRDTYAVLDAVMRFLRVGVDRNMLQLAIAGASLEAMREVEVERGHPGPEYDRSDIQSWLVREERSAASPTT